MSDRPAGWYPDPDGENRQRYWDGDRWTEYYTPLAPVETEIHGAATASADYPYLTATRTGSHHGLMVSPSAPPPKTAPATGWPASSRPAAGWPTAAPAPQGAETQEFNGGGSRSSANRWALVAASILVVGLVAGVGWWALIGRGSEDPVPDPTTVTAAPTDGETSTGVLSLDSPAAGDIPVGGAWMGTLELDGETTLLIDARAASSGDDLQMTVAPQGGQPVATNDDRGGPLASMGDNALNPLVVATLEAGTYEVTVTNRTGEETTFDITAAVVSAEVGIGAASDGTVPAGSAWVALLTVDSAGEHRIDVTGVSSGNGDTPDPLLVMIGPGGEQLVNDDRGHDERDPLLEHQLEAGSWVLLVTDYFARELEIRVEVTAVP